MPVKKPACESANGKPIMPNDCVLLKGIRHRLFFFFFLPAPTVALTKLKATSNFVREPYPGLSDCNKSRSAFVNFKGGDTLP
jgi:hypothetical protein